MSSKQQLVYVKQKGGFSTGCMIGLGIIFALVFVFVIMPAGCTIFAGKAIMDEAEKQRKDKEKSESFSPAPVE